MMNELELKKQLMNSFKELSLNDKRNEYFNEVTYLSLILNNYLKKYGFNELTSTYDYNKESDIKLSEDVLLLKSYMDIIELKNVLSALLSHIDNK